MLQIDVLVDNAREHESALRAAVAARRTARRAAPLRVRAGMLLIRLGRVVAGDLRRIPVWQG